MTRITVLSSSYVLYLSLLLLSSKNGVSELYNSKFMDLLQAACPENSAQAAFLYAHCSAPVSQLEEESGLNPVQREFEPLREYCAVCPQFHPMAEKPQKNLSL